MSNIPQMKLFRDAYLKHHATGAHVQEDGLKQNATDAYV
jgi:hypothetical protein